VPSTSHDVSFPFSWRFLQAAWKTLFFRNKRFEPDVNKSAEINRGAYLSNALAHCGECHTRRNAFGGLDYDRWMAGTKDGPGGGGIPNLTPDAASGLTWSIEQIAEYLKTGQNPDFDFAGSLMAEVIEHNTGQLTETDRIAIARYLVSLQPIAGER
jgi:mono/diheme cytochrome c family protein